MSWQPSWGTLSKIILIPPFVSETNMAAAPIVFCVSAIPNNVFEAYRKYFYLMKVAVVVKNV